LFEGKDRGKKKRKGRRREQIAVGLGSVRFPYSNLKGGKEREKKKKKKKRKSGGDARIAALLVSRWAAKRFIVCARGKGEKGKKEEEFSLMQHGRALSALFLGKKKEKEKRGGKKGRGQCVGIACAFLIAYPPSAGEERKKKKKKGEGGGKGEKKAGLRSQTEARSGWPCSSARERGKREKKERRLVSASARASHSQDCKKKRKGKGKEKGGKVIRWPLARLASDYLL